MGRNEEFHNARLSKPEVVESIHLPPTPEAMDHIHGALMDHQMNQLDEEIERKDKAVKTAKARNSPYAMKSQHEAIEHLQNVHGAWPEDTEGKPHEELARWHQSWHGDGNEDHEH